MTDITKLFFQAAECGRLSTLQRLYQEHKDDIDIGWANPARHNQNTPLLAAAENGHNHIVLWILENTNAPIDQANSDGDTALMWTAYNGFEAETRRLLELHADVNHTGKYGENALGEATRGGFANVVEILIEFGANVDIKTAFGMTPLHIAIDSYESFDIIPVLLTHGANPFCRDIKGTSALMMAATRQPPFVAEILLLHESGTMPFELYHFQ